MSMLSVSEYHSRLRTPTSFSRGTLRTYTAQFLHWHFPALDPFLVTHWSYVTWPAGSSFDDPATPDGKRWRATLSNLSEQKGCCSTRWARTVEDPRKAWLVTRVCTEISSSHDVVDGSHHTVVFPSTTEPSCDLGPSKHAH